MFELSFSELLLVIVVGLLVFGPDKLPHAARQAGLFFGRLKRSYQGVRREMERELGMDEVKRQLHNEEIMRSLGETPTMLKESVAEVKQSVADVKDNVTGLGQQLSDGVKQAQVDVNTPLTKPSVNNENP